MSESTAFPTGKYRVHFSGDVIIDVQNGNAIDRCLNDEDGWRTKMYYDLATTHEVFNHLAYNCVVNGIERVNRLDGWADLEDDDVRMQVDSFEADEWDPV